MSAAPDDPNHGHTVPVPEPEIPEGLGTRLAEWTIAAIEGRPAAPDGLDAADARRLRRVNDAVASLTEAAP